MKSKYFKKIIRWLIIIIFITNSFLSFSSSIIAQEPSGPVTPTDILNPIETPTPTKISVTPTSAVLITPAFEPTTAPSTTITPVTETPTPTTSPVPVTPPMQSVQPSPTSIPQISPSESTPTVTPTVQVVSEDQPVTEALQNFINESSSSATVTDHLIRLPFDGSYWTSLDFGETPDDPYLQEEYKSFGIIAHDGIDYELPENTNVLAADRGIVISAGPGMYGTTVVIYHTWGITYYGHLSSVNVEQGQIVETGELIGYSGHTGLATGPHLHFSVKPKNPDLENGFHGMVDPSIYLITEPQSEVLGISDKKIISKNLKVFKLNENPEIEFTINNVNLKYNLRDSSNKRILVQETITKKNNKNYFSFSGIKNFRPGKYTLTLTNGEGEAEEQEFYWGVLAVNTNKSVYLPGETAYLQMASLNDIGHTICKGKLELTINNEVLSTENDKIKYSDSCNGNNVTDSPDYYAYYQLDKPGTYQMNLKNLDNGFEINDSFEVKNNLPFEVERIGATRINPFKADYVMTLKIKTNQDFKGEIKELVPNSFEITRPLSESSSEGKLKFETKNSGDQKNIIWNADWKMGDKYEIQYQYHAPKVSPQLYMFGPLQFISNYGNAPDIIFQEARQWQIASDTVTTYSPSSNTSSWTNPTNAYADGTNYANITSGSPSASETYGNYGISLGASDVINTVKVRYDVSSIGTTGLTNTKPATTQSGSWTAGASGMDDNNTYASSATNGQTHVYKGFGYALGSTVSITRVRIRLDVKAATNDKIKLEVSQNSGSTYLATTWTSAALTTTEETDWTDVTSWGTWTPSVINSDNLAIRVTQVKSGSQDTTYLDYIQAEVTYSNANDEQIKVYVSYDGGSSYPISTTTGLSGSETTYWYDVTSATTWTATKLNNSNLKVKVEAITVGPDTGDVRLDWIPVEVDYTPPSVSGSLGKSTDGWAGAIPVYMTLTGLNQGDYPYARAQVTTAASQTVYYDMTWDSGDSRFEGTIYPGSNYCTGCDDPTYGSFSVTVQLDNNAGFPSVDYSASAGSFTTVRTFKRSSMDNVTNTNYTDFNPVWNTDHWDWSISDFGFAMQTGTGTNVAVAVPILPSTSSPSNFTVAYDGSGVSQGSAQSTSNAWWYNSSSHTLYVQFASLTTTLVDVDITFDLDTDLFATRFNWVYTADMGSRDFANGLIIANQYLTAPIYGTPQADCSGNECEGAGMQAETRAHEAGGPDESTDCMERVAVHVDDTIRSDGTTYYQYDIKWKLTEWASWITEEDNNHFVVITNSDNTASTGWAQQLNNNISAKRTQTFYSGKRYIKNVYEFKNNDSISHKYPMVWEREQWHATDRQTNDHSRFYGDTSDRVMEQRVSMSGFSCPWQTAYDSGTYINMGIIYDKNNLVDYGIAAVEAFLAPTTAEWPITITNPHATTTADQTGFEKTWSSVAAGETVSLTFWHVHNAESSWADIETAMNADCNELNPSGPTLDQLMRHGMWFNSSGAKQSFTF